MTVNFQRARSAEHKQERRQMILEAASRVLDRGSFAEASLNAIAKEAGVVKSGLYRYFESREEILLELMLHDVETLSQNFDANVTGPLSIEELAHMMAQGFIERPRLGLLISRMSSVLEHNITGDTLRRFKRRLNQYSADTAVAMCRAVPHWDDEAAQRALKMLYMLVSGVYPMTHPPAHVAEVMCEPEFEHTNVEFADMVEYAACAMFRGVDQTIRANAVPIAVGHL